MNGHKDGRRDRVEKSQALFTEGFNCSQSVLAGFSESLGLDRATAAKLATGMGGGMGRMGQTCGAVSGAFLALGLKHGGATAQDKEAKDKTYRLVREFAARFKARNGSLQCRELLGCDISTEAGFAEARQKGLLTTVCPKMVRDAGEILEELL